MNTDGFCEGVEGNILISWPTSWSRHSGSAIMQLRQRCSVNLGTNRSRLLIRIDDGMG